MKKLVLQSTLNHKQSSYEPLTVEVEKVITLYGNEFHKLMRETLMDNLYIKNNRELMYFDGDTAHCVLFVDNETGNGMLVEAQGYGYARESQFIPYARGILESHELTVAEWKIHEAIKSIADRIAEQAHSGNTKFSADEFWNSSKINISDLLLDALTATLREREDIQSAVRLPITVPYQADVMVTAKPVVELKLFAPLEVEREPEYETDWDGGDDYEQLSDYEKIACENEINAFIRNYATPEEANRGLMTYYSDNPAVNEKVVSAFPSVEVKNDELMGDFPRCGEMSRSDRGVGHRRCFHLQGLR